MIQLCNEVVVDRSSSTKADPYRVQGRGTSAELSGLWRGPTIHQIHPIANHWISVTAQAPRLDMSCID